MSYKSYSIIFICLLLISGCTQHRSTKNLLRDATSSLNKTYKTNNGQLILQYDLNNSRNSCLHSKTYGRIINNPKINKSYITKTLNKKLSRNNIVNNAKHKLRTMHRLAYKLREKYRIPLRLVAIDKIIKNSSDKGFYGARATSARLNIYARQFAEIPVFNPEANPQLTSPFGVRIHPITGVRSMHKGIDLLGHRNSAEIYAAANGIVTFAGRQNNYGNIVVIDHAHGLQSKYAHLRHITVTQGETVLMGQKIGLQGASGNVTNEHLHFEILLNNQHIDPADFLAPNLNCH